MPSSRQYIANSIGFAKYTKWTQDCYKRDYNKPQKMAVHLFLMVVKEE